MRLFLLSSGSQDIPPSYRQRSDGSFISPLITSVADEAATSRAKMLGKSILVVPMRRTVPTSTGGICVKTGGLESVTESRRARGTVPISGDGMPADVPGAHLRAW